MRLRACCHINESEKHLCPQEDAVWAKTWKSLGKEHFPQKEHLKQMPLRNGARCGQGAPKRGRVVRGGEELRRHCIRGRGGGGGVLPHMFSLSSLLHSGHCHISRQVGLAIPAYPGLLHSCLWDVLCSACSWANPWSSPERGGWLLVNKTSPLCLFTVSSFLILGVWNDFPK